jgi:hypothetical protein
LAVASWGLLGPETLSRERRVRTLGVGAAVRQFNDLAVPGLGGVWFVKELLLATIGVAVAEEARKRGRRVQNIEAANAIEALACWLALEGNGWKAEARIRGATKMRGKTDLSFESVRRASFYVTQPMRMATVQPLRALSVVDAQAERFNAYRMNELGREFIDSGCGAYTPYNRGVVEHLVGWAIGEHGKVSSSGDLTGALSPLSRPSATACESLRDLLVKGAGAEAARRRRVLAWVDELRHAPRAASWKQVPKLLDESHWRDMQSGALFFRARDEAIGLLEAIETQISGQVDQKFHLDGPVLAPVSRRATSLRAAARAFLDYEHDPSPEQMGSVFCRECIDRNLVGMIEKLVERDGRVLVQRGRFVVPGSAFRGRTDDVTEANSDEASVETALPPGMPLPEGISHRVGNLYLLNLDMRGELDAWLKKERA